MRQAQKVLRLGDYYEVQTQEEALPKPQKTIRKQQLPSSTLSLPMNQQIITQIPSRAQARQAYFFVNNKDGLQHRGFEELQDELIEILGQEEEEDLKSEVEQLLKEVRREKENMEIGLNVMLPDKNQTKPAEKMVVNEIQLVIRVDLKNIQNRLKRLQQLNYPQISQLQNLIQIMLGQKTPTAQTINPTATAIINLGDKTKQEIQTLYTHFSSLSCLNNLYGLIEDLHHNDGKFIEMAQWVRKAEIIGEMNRDFSMELDADLKLVQELTTKFKENLQIVKDVVRGYKERKKA